MFVNCIRLPLFECPSYDTSRYKYGDRFQETVASLPLNLLQLFVLVYGIVIIRCFPGD